MYQAHAIEDALAKLIEYYVHQSFPIQGLLRFVPGEVYVSRMPGVSSKDAAMLAPAFDSIKEQMGPIMSPIVIKVGPDGVEVEIGSVRTSLDRVRETISSLRCLDEFFRRNPQSFAPEDGGDHRYLIGFPGRNLPVDHLASVQANSALEAVMRLIAGRVNLSEAMFVPRDLDLCEKGKMTMRRAHDWARYDFDDLVETACHLCDAAIEARIDWDCPESSL